VVLYSSNNTLFRAIAPNTNVVPTTTTSWKQITEDASALTAGTLPNGRLNAAYTGILSLAVTGAVSAASFSGSGAALTNMSAAQMTTGVLPNGRLNGAYTGILSLAVTGRVSAGSFDGNGALIDSLNASQLATGTVADARLPATMTGKSFTTGIDFGSATVADPLDLSRHIALYGGSYGFSVSSSRLNIMASSGGLVQFRFGSTNGPYIGPNGYYGDGDNLTTLNASALASGTVPNARITGNYSGFAAITTTAVVNHGNMINDGYINCEGNVYGKLVHNNGGGYVNIGSYDTATYGSGYGQYWWSENDQRFTFKGSVRTEGHFYGSGHGLTDLHAEELNGTIPLANMPGVAATTTATWIGNNYSDLSTTGIGALCFAVDKVDRSTGWGSSRNGTDLIPSSADEATGTSIGTGVWRCLGRTFSDGDDDYRRTLWQRIS
jgi:hypothetical protein